MGCDDGKNYKDSKVFRVNGENVNLLKKLYPNTSINEYLNNSLKQAKLLRGDSK